MTVLVLVVNIHQDGHRHLTDLDGQWSSSRSYAFIHSIIMPLMWRLKRQQCRETSRYPALSPVRKEAIRVAAGTHLGHLNVLGQQPCHQQLVPIGLPEIQEQRRIAARSLLYKKYGRLPYQVAVPLRRRHLRELRLALKKVLDLGGDFVTTGSDGWTYSCQDICRPGTELLTHRLHRRGGSTSSSAAPPRMRHPQHTLYRIVEQDGWAIAEGQRQRNIASFSDDGIGLAPGFKCPHHFLLFYTERPIWPV